MNIKLYSFILCCPLLVACQNSSNLLVNQDDPSVNLYLDNEFYSDKTLAVETEQEIFQLNTQMRDIVETTLTRNMSVEEKASSLLNHLFNEEKIALTYKTNANLTASQTYQSKEANCMSLTILAYALADAAGLEVSFRDVEVPEYWVRNGSYNLLAGHVNLRILDNYKQSSYIYNTWSDDAFTIDFDPYVAKRKLPSREINKQRLIAMFYNNKGAEAMVSGDYNQAYQYLKHATLLDDSFSPAWGNLGILYKLAGHVYEAEFAYIRAVNLRYDNLNSLSNLALLLREQNRADEAALIEEHIYDIRIINPYYHALLGNEALHNKSYQEASIHYRKAIDLDDSQHEFYFGLAKAYYKQGKLTLARRAIKDAVGHTKVTKIKKQYVAKLNVINAY